MDEPVTAGRPRPPRLEPAPFSSSAVSDVGSGLIVGCDPDASLEEVAGRMSTHRVHCVVVFDRTQGMPWKVITDLDVARVAARGERPPAAAIAGAPVVVVREADSLVDAARTLARQGASHAVVVDDDRGMPSGIISSLDIVHAIACESGPIKSTRRSHD